MYYIAIKEKSKMPELRNYQDRAIIQLRDCVSNGLKKVIMALPTGGGKSLIFGQIISNAIDKEKTVLWLVHRRNLVYQMRDVLQEFGIDCGLIMAGNESNTKLPVQLCTIQTLGRRLKLADPFSNQFFINADIVLIDEGHRSISKTYMDIIKLYQDKIIIACTATPMRADGMGMGKVYEAIVDVSGVQELIDQKYLSPVRYFAAKAPNLKDIKIARGDYVVKELGKKMNKTKLNGDIVENWLKFGENRQTIVFCVNVKHSIAICEEFTKQGVSAEHLDARSSDEKRDDVFQRMEDGDTKVICNVGLYQEGLDVPAVSCIVMARPTKSMGLWRQCCGRGLRILPGKEDCFIFDHGGVIEEHGFLEDEIEWTLDGKKIAWKKKKRKKSEPKPAKCRVCGEIFMGLKTCPRCGTELKKFGKKIETVDAELVELKGVRKRNREYSWDDKRKLMGALQWHVEKKGYRNGWAAHTYKDFFGVWPNDKRVKDVAAIEPQGNIKNLLTHILIKKAKQYQKKRAANG